MWEAGHIDPWMSGRNGYWFWDRRDRAKPVGPGDFAESEARYYNTQYEQALAAQNSRHIEARHMNRIKTMEDWMSGRNTRPEESIYQIGDMTSEIDPGKFKKAALDLLNFLVVWEMRNGHPYKVLNMAIHMDEASPHIHLRKVWQYQDEHGVWCIGQNKALEAAGVELPDPDAKRG